MTGISMNHGGKELKTLAQSRRIYHWGMGTGWGHGSRQAGLDGEDYWGAWASMSAITSSAKSRSWTC